MRYAVYCSLFFALAAMTGNSHAAATPFTPRDPELAIPWCKHPPCIDGQLSPGEWDFAAGVSMLEAYPSGWPRAMRQEQPVFFVFRDTEYLYVAMESLDSNTTGIAASCVMHDNLRIVGDDCVDMMIAPGAGEQIKQYDFPTYYFALNSIGTVWDCKFVPLLNEAHNSWESGIQVANDVDGTYWVCETRIPLAAIKKELPGDGTVWRMNFDRTYSGYHWSAWNAGGGLNDCRVGGNVTFDRAAPAVRMRKTNSLVDGQLKVVMEVANSTDKPRTVKLELAAEVGQDARQITVNPGELKEITLGLGEKLAAVNVVTVKATDEAGKTLYFVERQVNVPSPWFAKKVAPKVPLVHIFPRFLPSLERLAVEIDYTAWAKKTGVAAVTPSVEVKVWQKGEETGRPAMEGTLTGFTDNRGTWRGSTVNLPEGDYVVKVKVTSGRNTLAEYDDWFEKKIFDWMRTPRGIGEAAPAPYTALETAGRTVKSWGREYALSPTGLPADLRSQGRSLLTGQAALTAETGGKTVPVEVVEPYVFTDRGPTRVTGRSVLRAGGLRIELESITEYDGFILYRMTYGPEKEPVTIDRLRLRLPIAAQHAKFYSAAGDTQGTTIPGDVLPEKQGRVYDSLENTRSVCCSPTFATLFWTGDYDVCLCYASDSDKGWLIRDDAPAVEAWREGDTVSLWLNLVDKRYTLTKPRTLEFAFQAGPTKPLPDGWRGIQDSRYATDAPTPLAQIGLSGDPMRGGGYCFIHPGETAEEQERSRKHIEGYLAKDNKAVMGYVFWPIVTKGFRETRVFRGEWGIDKQTWENPPGSMHSLLWSRRYFGENKDRYVYFNTGGRPSYVDFLTYAYDLALEATPLNGVYDDCGYPNPIYDEELGLGFIREDGRKIYSSGLWIYRERWKRTAYVNSQHARLNCTGDSQHAHAHFLPAYHFIGLWRPCERGYYNPFKDRDNLEFYGSLERYAALNPARAFGQPGQIGLRTPQTAPEMIARDTRCMMMLTMLHDQDLNCFSNGDAGIVERLRRARNRFRPWERDVSFHGYWESDRLVKTDARNVPISLYRRPGAALLVLGNTGETDANVTVTPAWRELGLIPAAVRAADAENDEAIALNGSFTVQVKRHDLRVILIAKP